MASLILKTAVYTLTLWLGLYLIERNGAKPALCTRWLGLWEGEQLHDDEHDAG